MKSKKDTECGNFLLPVRDALDVINGKWKLEIIISISAGNNRFREIVRSIPKITTKVLAKELRVLEENHLIKRTVHDSPRMLIEYTLKPHAKSLGGVLQVLRDWGISHRKEVFGSSGSFDNL